MTVFLTTHYLDEADALADRLLVIDNGTIVASGTPDTLKAGVSGDAVSVEVSPESLARTAQLAADLPGAHEVTVLANTIKFRVARGDTALPQLLRALDGAGVATVAMAVNRPSLDDVFLHLTGRSLREDGAPPSPGPTIVKEGSDVA